MTRVALIDHVPLPQDHVHRIRGEGIAGARGDARGLLREFFGTTGSPLRAFDLILLGMGRDGHTASIFPGTIATTEPHRWAMPVHVEARRAVARDTHDVSSLARQLTDGSRYRCRKSAEAPRGVGAGSSRGPLVPAQLVRQVRGAFHWTIDAAAGAELDRHR